MAGMAGAADPLDVVDRLITAIQNGAVDEYRSLYSPDAVIWTCFDDRERNVDSSVGVIEWMLDNTTERHYDIRRRIAIEGGVLQQHVLRGTSKHRDREFSMPACLVIMVGDDGKITRVEEYLDPSAITAAIG
jgi:ketosteroid isomerase-like protein